jgi:hypothetical protein
MNGLQCMRSPLCVVLYLTKESIEFNGPCKDYVLTKAVYLKAYCSQAF